MTDLDPTEALKGMRRAFEVTDTAEELQHMHKRERAIGAALQAIQAEPHTASDTSSRPRPSEAAWTAWRSRLLWLVPGLAAAAAGFWLVLSGPESPGPEVDAKLGGQVVRAPPPEASPAPSLKPQPQVDPTPTELAKGQRVTLGRARVTAQSDETQISFTAEHNTVHLLSGGAEFDVKPDPTARFVVRTSGFRVEVLGTVFSVSSEQVSVSSGAVRVIGSDGEVLAERVSEGESWVAETTPGRQAQHQAAPQSVERTPAVGTLLRDARRALAEKRVAEARAKLAVALRMAKHPSERDEAQTLLAECEVASGNHAQAAELYRQVADDTSDQHAVENALFGAALSEAKAGNRAAASRLFRRYLERYPDGRFASQARSELARHPD